MIKCGTDIIEVGRIKEALEKKGFKGRVYTENEIKYCENTKAIVEDLQQKKQYLKH